MGLLDQLQSFGQGASNAAAMNVTGPIDALAWALRKLGVPIPDNPMLGSKWAREQGLTAEPNQKIAGLLGETAGLALPIGVQAKTEAMRGLLR